jgi:hypothetical protein
MIEVFLNAEQLSDSTAALAAGWSTFFLVEYADPSGISNVIKRLWNSNQPTLVYVFDGGYSQQTIQPLLPAGSTLTLVGKIGDHD